MAELALRLARLGGGLRAQGVPTSLRDELDAADALGRVDGEDRDEVRRTLRIALKLPPSAWEAFERLFARFWSGAPEPAPEALSRRPSEAPPLPSGRALHWDPETRRMGGAPATAGEHQRPGWSPEALLRRKSFEDGAWSPAELVAMERLLARLARRLATRRGRRLVPTVGRGRPDLRRSYRRALRTSGELVRLARRARALSEPRLVFLLDTSGSMDAHGRFLIAFVLALRRAVPSAEVFAFNTGLVRLTPSLRPGQVRLTLERLAADVPDWSGGTRIGACLEAFVSAHLTRRVDGRTVVVVLSDGLDRGEPARLAEALRAIRGRARRLVWLNPLMADARYEPAARGMQAALPYVDHLAAANDLESLERLLPHLAV